MRCAIYTRVSTDEQAMSEYSSLGRQEKLCRNYVDIQAEKGWKVCSPGRISPKGDRYGCCK